VDVLAFFDGHPTEAAIIVAVIALAVLGALETAVRAWDCWLRRRGRGHVIVDDRRHPSTVAPEMHERPNGDVVVILRDPMPAWPPTPPAAYALVIPAPVRRA
jgi:hypothetical protein